jgi:tetratricopeptide (TPR) repeat protein
MTAALVTAAMIVRDEAAVLDECLRSIRDVVDEIVVVDTGSTDESPRIARAHGARVVEFPWRGDFSAARNEALARARGGWILYIDADERLRDATRAALESALAEPGVVAHTVRFRPQTGFTRYREYRIFRNDPRIRFRGVIHETMLPDIQRVAASDCLRIAHSPFAMDHVGYDGDQQHKHRRNVPLLRARLQADPAHVFSWHHLGRALEGLGEGEEAAAAWRRGIDIVRGTSRRQPADSLPYVALISLELDRGGDPRALLDEAKARCPGNLLLTFLEGRTLMAAGRHAEAMPIFERLASIDADAFCDDTLAYDARMFGVASHESLGLCCFRLGRFAESAAHYARAAAEAPDDPAHRVKQRLALARAARETAQA